MFRVGVSANVLRSGASSLRLGARRILVLTKQTLPTKNTAVVGPLGASHRRGREAHLSSTLGVSTFRPLSSSKVLRSAAGDTMPVTVQVPAGATSPKEAIDQLIASHKLMMFSKMWCPFCRRGKDALDSVVGPENYAVFELEDMERGSLVSGSGEPADFQDYFKEIAGTRTVPKVFLGGKFIGGGDEVTALAKSGQLETMAIKAGVLKPAKTAAPTETNVRYFVNGKQVAAPDGSKY
ncbi:unnamed protein product [Amoebophrya sp. A25]|nr:unnamed protein product [Amoebophrya sp. A25]|eukprot:GSA25T00025301001.1